MLVTCLKMFSGSLIPYTSIYSKRAGKIISFYLKMTLFGIDKIYTNAHQIAPFFKIFWEDLLNPVMYAHLSLYEKNYNTKRPTFPNF